MDFTRVAITSLKYLITNIWTEHTSKLQLICLIRPIYSSMKALTDIMRPLSLMETLHPLLAHHIASQPLLKSFWLCKQLKMVQLARALSHTRYSVLNIPSGSKLSLVKKNGNGTLHQSWLSWYLSCSLSSLQSASVGVAVPIKNNNESQTLFILWKQINRILRIRRKMTTRSISAKKKMMKMKDSVKQTQSI